MEDENTEEKPTVDVLQDPWEMLFARLSGIETRLALVEGVAHSGHELNEEAINHIAGRVFDRLNALIRARFDSHA